MICEKNRARATDSIVEGPKNRGYLFINLMGGLILTVNKKSGCLALDVTVEKSVLLRIIFSMVLLLLITIKIKVSTLQSNLNLS